MSLLLQTRIRLRAVGLAVPIWVASVGAASAGTDEGTFVDVTDEAEVSYVQWRPPLDYVKHTPQVMTGGAAVADFDNDGWTDLYVTRYRDSDLLFRNLGDGTFEEVSQEAGIDGVIAPSNGAAWGDIDNDGDPDLYVSVVDEVADPLSYLLYINGGDGTFVEEAQLRGAGLTVPHYHSGFSHCFGDYDLDGWLDIHTCQWAVTGPGNRSVLLRNTGSPGHFVEVTAAAGVEMWHSPESPPGTPPEFTTQAFTSRLSDIDRDGWPDLVVAGDFGTSRLFWNNRDGSFSDGTTAAQIGGDENGMGLAIGDYDGDGMPDLFFTSIFDPRRPEIPIVGWGVSGNRLYRNRGDRSFDDTTDHAGVRDGGWGWGAVFFDYDNDGDLDLAMTNGFETDRLETETPFHTDPTKLWRNDGGTFTDVSAAMGITDDGLGKGLLVFDYDKDGDLDLFVVNNRGTPTLYRNEVAPAHHWLRVAVTGRYSNRDGIGTLVTIWPGGDAQAQVREIGGGSHYLAQSEKLAHFGLGSSDAPVARLIVRWPSGIEQDFHNVAVDRVIELTEPATPYRAWLAEHFSKDELKQSSVIAPGADPDHDGLSNAVEFGCGLDPRTSESLSPITVLGADETSSLSFSFRRRHLPRGVDVVVESSADLQRWQELDPASYQVVSTQAEEDWGVETVTALMDGSAGGSPGSTHLRLRVEVEE